MHYKKTN